MNPKRPYVAPQIVQTEPLAPPDVETAGAENCEEGPSTPVTTEPPKRDPSRTSR